MSILVHRQAWPGACETFFFVNQRKSTYCGFCPYFEGNCFKIEVLTFNFENGC